VPAGSVTAFAPGRVTLLGDHTDYNGGLSLPFAIDRGVTVRATSLPGPLLMARARDVRESDAFNVFEPGAPDGVDGWRALLRGVAAELAAAGHPLRPARLEIAGTVQPRVGLGASAALTAALALALVAFAGDEAPDRRALAAIGARVELLWAGRHAGLLDHYAALLAREGHALRVDFHSGVVEPVPLELGDWALVVVPVGERRVTPAPRRGERRRECAEAARALGVGALSQAGRGPAGKLPSPLRERALHVLAENDRVRVAERALRAGDLPGLGSLLDASHASLRDNFDVSTPEVERAVERVKERGAAGARVLGGAHVLALLPPEVAPPPGARRVAPAGAARLSG